MARSSRVQSGRNRNKVDEQALWSRTQDTEASHTHTRVRGATFGSSGLAALVDTNTVDEDEDEDD